MAASVNPLHSSELPKKIAGRAKAPARLNKFGRDPQSPSERMRASSDYETEKGYAPFFHAFMADWPRLSSGEVSCLLFNLVLCKSLGRGTKKGEPRPTKTLPMKVSELAEHCKCDERSIERELNGWQTRKVAAVTREAKGLVSIELLYKTWETLPDYKKPVDIATGKPAEEAAPEPTRIELTKDPVPCKAGGKSRAVKVDCSIRTFHLVNPSVVDFDITAVLQAGDLVITTKVPEAWLTKAAKQAASGNGFNELSSSPRHGRPQEKTRVDHPRAAELVKLFDPLLGKSQAVLLSMDPSALQAACNAIKDCDHDYLVKFVIQRAASKISKPSHVKIICTEALESWKVSKEPGLIIHDQKAAQTERPRRKSFAEGVLQDVRSRLARGEKL
jgi:hypothetical protein